MKVTEAAMIDKTITGIKVSNNITGMRGETPGTPTDIQIVLEYIVSSDHYRILLIY